MHRILPLLTGIFFLINFNSKAQNQFPLDFNKNDQAFSSAKLDTLTDFLERSGSSSLIILHKGQVAYEWGETHKKHTIHSIRKALLNSLYGIYINNGTIDTTLTLAELEIDDIEPSLSKTEKSATIADLLRSRSGVYHNAAAVSAGMLENMPQRGAHQPNEAYYYNNWDFNTLGHILEKLTGESVYDLFYNDIAKPFGMDFKNNYIKAVDPAEDWEIPEVDGFYQYETSKSRFPAFHFRLSARDLALFGQLYLNDGNWAGNQIIPEEWIEVSTKPFSITDKNYGIGYGMLWSILIPNENRKTKSYFHTGVGVHMLAVYPSSDMVLVHRVDTEKEYSFHKGHFYKMISLVWDSKL